MVIQQREAGYYAQNMNKLSSCTLLIFVRYIMKL